MCLVDWTFLRCKCDRLREGLTLAAVQGRMEKWHPPGGRSAPQVRHDKLYPTNASVTFAFLPFATLPLMTVKVFWAWRASRSSSAGFSGEKRARSKASTRSIKF